MDDVFELRWPALAESAKLTGIAREHLLSQLEPAYDSYFSSLANTTPAQSSITPMAMALAKLESATNLSPYFWLENGMGVGGEPYSSLASGTTEYINLTNALNGAVGLLPSGWALNVPAIPYVQGGSDSQAGTSRSSYASDLATLESNLTSSVETITGQSNAPTLLLTQETNLFGPFGSALQRRGDNRCGIGRRRRSSVDDRASHAELCIREQCPAERPSDRAWLCVYGRIHGADVSQGSGVRAGRSRRELVGANPKRDD